MMFEMVKLTAKHLEELIAEPKNMHLVSWLATGHADELAKADSVTGMVDGQIMFCGGALPYWTGRAFIWGVFSERSKHHGIPVFRGIKKWIDERPYRRLEVDVPLDVWFTDVAKRRVRLLGFGLECERAKFYRSNGKDSALYSLVKEHPNV